MRAFRITLPSAERYWTVVDDEYRIVGDVDEYLRHLRFGHDAAESTTKAYAESLTLYLRWCEHTQRDWRTAAERLGAFATWLRHTPIDPEAPLIGPGLPEVRGPGRINRILAAVRGFLRHSVAVGTAPPEVLAMLFEVSDNRHLPVEAGGEDGALHYMARPRHRLSEPETGVDRATDEEALALLGACRSARDRFIVVAMARAGLRRGELCGLRREDIHFVADASGLGCTMSGSHLHVRRRVNINGAWAKSRRPRAVPVDDLLVLAYDTYVFERDRCRPARECDFVLVNLFHPPLGSPMRPGAIIELLTGLSRRAHLSRRVHPHQLRHGFASDVLDAGGSIDEAQQLLGHARAASTQVYAHPSAQRLRDAVERVAALNRDGVSR
ncbi:tyrosine-type recombinase/integrase [Rhodococcus sp. WAY2]|uniref:tyrosine-type recombinase/integrase n=1 Tax=Rhodococcus sp. WAY2 TaxID=2663121 RepID=UPI00131FD788|nr:tyrosine-type recombinase/integrase [Rhodococcus sp. WAY2]QHE73884.1 Site-specific tyrosine recombinase [Rhodococcus sp. WAY2]